MTIPITIETVKEQGGTWLVNDSITVPKDESNDFCKAVNEWIANGGVVASQFTDAEIIAKAQVDAKAKRTPELEYADHQQNILLDAGQPPSAAWSAYRASLRDMTTNPLWATDPTAVVDAIIATRPS